MKLSSIFAISIFFSSNAQQFGKTHFIVGLEKNKYPKDKQNSSPCKPPEALFSCQDNVQQALIKAINNETKQIEIAIFNFTSKEIAQALLKAKRRGIDILIITDESSAKEKYSKIPLLFNRGIPIYIFQGKSGRMHHKFAIFSDKIWTGSFNFTKSAHTINQENVVIIYETNIKNKYKSQFEKLRNKSGRLKQLPIIEIE